MATLPPPVVVAVGRRGSASAIEFAAAEALRLQVGLHLVHSVGHVHGHAHAGEGGSGSTTADPDGIEVLAVAERHALAVVDGLQPVTWSQSTAPAVTAVVDAVPDTPLIVVGRCPESRRTHPYVKSVTGGVAARSHAPVASVPDGWVEVAGARPVVVGVDDPSLSPEVLRAGFVAARARRTGLMVLSTWWRPGGTDRRPLTHVDDPEWLERLRGGIDRAMTELCVTYPDVTVEIHVQNARAGETLIDASREAQLLVVGRHDPLVPTGSHLGPVARSVLREAACPVLLATPHHPHLVQRRNGHQTQPA